MEPESKPTFWNVEASDFVPSGVPSFVPKSVAPSKPKDSKPKKSYPNKSKPGYPEEQKFAAKSKDCISLSFLGPPSSGKSSLANTLSPNTQCASTPQYRVLSYESKSRRYSIFDSTGTVQDQVISMSHSDHFLVVFSVQNQGQEDYFKEISTVLRNFANGRVIVALSHMDEIHWDCNGYNEAVQRIRQAFDRQGLRDTIFIPISPGVNVLQRVAKDIAPWYNGKSLMQAVDTLETPLKKTEKKGVRMVLLPLNNDRTTFLARIISGTLTLQSKLIIMPVSLRVEILAITDVRNSPIDAANTGEVVVVSIRLPEEITSLQGLIVCENQEKCVISKEFRGEVTFLNLEDQAITGGYTCGLLLHSAEENAEITEVVSGIDLKTRAKVKTHTARNEMKAIVIVRAENMISAENISKGCDFLGKFCLVKGGKVIGVGRILELHNKVEEIASQMGF